MKKHLNYILMGLLLCSTSAYGADSKVTALPDLPTMVSTDTFYCVDDPTGSPISSSCKVSNILTDALIPDTITVDLATTVTTNANLTGEVTSVGNAATIADSITVNGWTLGTSFATMITTNITGALTGQADTVGTITGLAPDTATTQATQPNITSAANLVTVGTIGTGVWQGTAINQTYLVGQSGTNTGDQSSIVGITGTTAQFNTANTDGDFAISGGAFHDGFSDFVPNEHIDWTASGAGTVHATNYVDSNTTYVSSDFVHDDLTGFVANEHLDWTASVGTINTDNYIENATHTGEVTGSGALTIVDNIIDEANLKLDTTPTNDYVLTADSTTSGGMKWAASAGGFTDPMTTRGDVIVRDATNTTARLGIGTNGYVLTSDGTDIAWAAGGTGGGATTSSGGVTYVTNATDDFAIGGTDNTAPFFFDESEGQLVVSGASTFGSITATTAGLSSFAKGAEYNTSNGSDTDNDVTFNGSTETVLFIDVSENTAEFGSSVVIGGTGTVEFNASKGATNDFVVQGDTVDNVLFIDVSADAIYSEGNKVDFGDVTEDYVMTFNATTDTWAGEVAGGGGATTLTSGVVHPTNSTDDFAIGGTTSSAPFFFDESDGELTITGDASTDNGLHLLNNDATDTYFVGLHIENTDGSSWYSQAGLKLTSENDYGAMEIGADGLKISRSYTTTIEMNSGAIIHNGEERNIDHVFHTDTVDNAFVIDGENNTATFLIAIVPAKVTADPCGDTTAYPEGSQFYNDTSNYYCYCNGTNDVKMSDDTTACF